MWGVLGGRRSGTEYETKVPLGLIWCVLVSEGNIVSERSDCTDYV